MWDLIPVIATSYTWFFLPFINLPVIFGKIIHQLFYSVGVYQVLL